MPKFLVSHDEKNFYVVYELTQNGKKLIIPKSDLENGDPDLVFEKNVVSEIIDKVSHGFQWSGHVQLSMDVDTALEILKIANYNFKQHNG